ncbi:ClpXP protease specificity-enhancing factor SspB [Candidatus Magnetaquicoccus inordinatus]|uniref:ClpXP protease specificity-enhancing factor SspB n=1 Tax=Candidatus Magnetaquicoccus inordinatus TaxID=2496818 RepID=UPI00187D656A|nr:ClpXP protease specificity-enhancing factor SspB [Candidatus Magnetaquicoccus inordinatus]
MTAPQLPDKASLLRLLLESEGRAMICLDATRKGVDVPRRFSNDPGLMLVFNVAMPQPIEILPHCVASELRFGGIPHYCVIPFTAVWSVFNPDTNHGMVWPDDMPESVRHSHGVLQLPLQPLYPDEITMVGGANEHSLSDDLPSSTPATRPPLQLRVIDGGQQEGEGAVTTSTSRKSGRPNLRLVE